MDQNITFAPEIEPQPSRVRKLLNWIAYPAGAIAGYFAGDTYVRNFIYKDIAQTGELADLKKASLKSLSDAIRECERTGQGNIPEFMAENNRMFSEAVLDRSRKWNFHNSSDYWRGLTRNQKVESAVFGITAGGIVLGALLAVANSKSLFSRLKRDRTKQGEPDVPPSASMPRAALGLADVPTVPMAERVRAGQDAEPLSRG